MHMFGVVCSKSRFPRELRNCQFDCSLVLRAGPIGTQNQKMRPLMDLFQRHERNDDLRILKRAPVRNHIFRGKPLVSIFIKLS